MEYLLYSEIDHNYPKKVPIEIIAATDNIAIFFKSFFKLLFLYE